MAIDENALIGRLESGASITLDDALAAAVALRHYRGRVREAEERYHEALRALAVTRDVAHKYQQQVESLEREAKVMDAPRQDEEACALCAGPVMDVIDFQACVHHGHAVCGSCRQAMIPRGLALPLVEATWTAAANLARDQRVVRHVRDTPLRMAESIAWQCEKNAEIVRSRRPAGGAIVEVPAGYKCRKGTK